MEATGDRGGSFMIVCPEESRRKSCSAKSVSYHFLIRIKACMADLLMSRLSPGMMIMHMNNVMQRKKLRKKHIFRYFQRKKCSGEKIANTHIPEDSVDAGTDTEASRAASMCIEALDACSLIFFEWTYR
jgi:hypothetical protein